MNDNKTSYEAYLDYKNYYLEISKMKNEIELSKKRAIMQITLMENKYDIGKI